MKLMQLWSDLSIWAKYGLSTVLAIVLLGIIFFIFF